MVRISGVDIPAEKKVGIALISNQREETGLSAQGRGGS